MRCERRRPTIGVCADDDECRGGDLRADGQTRNLDSPALKPGTRCFWRLRAARGQKIELNVTMVSFECDNACTSYVEIKYRREKTATGETATRRSRGRNSYFRRPTLLRVSGANCFGRQKQPPCPLRWCRKREAGAQLKVLRSAKSIESCEFAKNLI